MPERPDMTDDLDQAYTQSHALADGGRGPSAAVRANVLAAAREVAAEAAARVAAESAAADAARLPPLPVAAPVAAVGRGRSKAVNLSSWRVRAGAAFCAMLLVGLALWRFDESGRFKGDVQVALAELKLAAPAPAPMPQDLPLPAAAAASYPYAAPPRVVDDPVDGASNRSAADAKQRAHDKDKNLTVAQLDQQPADAYRAAPPLQSPAAVSPVPPAAPVAAEAAPPTRAAVVTSSANRVDAPPPVQEPTLVTITGGVPQIVTAPSRPPSVLPRRIMLVPKPASPPAAETTPPGETTVAAAAAAPGPASDAGSQRVEVAAAKAALSSAGVGDAMKKSAPSSVGSLVGASARVLPLPLHAAADRGDVDTLKRLLSNAATPVDAPDATGRTALLHAVLAQQAAAVRLLLAAGADPAHADQAGLTPRAAAQSGASAEIAALLATSR